jgi:hypothetical protein
MTVQITIKVYFDENDVFAAVTEEVFPRILLIILL